MWINNAIGGLYGHQYFDCCIRDYPFSRICVKPLDQWVKNARQNHKKSPQET
jgi:hypothetical protein